MLYQLASSTGPWAEIGYQIATAFAGLVGRPSVKRGESACYIRHDQLQQLHKRTMSVKSGNSCGDVSSTPGALFPLFLDAGCHIWNKSHHIRPLGAAQTPHFLIGL